MLLVEFCEHIRNILSVVSVVAGCDVVTRTSRPRPAPSIQTEPNHTDRGQLDQYDIGLSSESHEACDVPFFVAFQSFDLQIKLSFRGLTLETMSTTGTGGAAVKCLQARFERRNTRVLEIMRPSNGFSYWCSGRQEMQTRNNVSHGLRAIRVHATTQPQRKAAKCSTLQMRPSFDSTWFPKTTGNIFKRKFIKRTHFANVFRFAAGIAQVSLKSRRASLGVCVQLLPSMTSSMSHTLSHSANGRKGGHAIEKMTWSGSGGGGEVLQVLAFELK